MAKEEKAKKTESYCEMRKKQAEVAAKEVKDKK